MPSVNVTIRMDSSLKKQADQLFKDLGLTLSSAVNTFVSQAVREQSIPFKIQKNVEKTDPVNRELLDVLSDKEMDLHDKAYKELAK